MNLQNMYHARTQKVIFRGVPALASFLADEWIKISLKLDHHRPVSETPFKMAFRWRADGGPTLNAGLVA